MSIHVLDKCTIEKITAGEVIARPVSAVKELVENSIDAGATGITVEIKEGGLDYLRVTDNGCGIPEQEARIAFESHATSKLKNADELNEIMTLGFRGEALPSIAAISKVTMTTKTKDAESGIRLTVEGGTITDISAAGCPDGTTFVVKDMFYNVPVRRTFIKKPAYEQSLISELMQKLALGNPSIAFRFISSGKTVMQTYGDGDLLHACAAVYGNEYGAGLRRINESEGNFSITGVIGIGDQAMPTRARQFFYINGRTVECRMLSQALEEANRGRVTIGKYPACALFVKTAPGNIDVNVHPSKLEIRFRDEAAFRLTAQTLLARSFSHDTMLKTDVPATDVFPKKTVVAQDQPKAVTEEKKKDSPAPQKKFDLFDGIIPEMSSHIAPVKTDEVRESRFAFSEPAAKRIIPEVAVQQEIAAPSIKKADDDYRYIGVFNETYILLEKDDSLILIDQHAAHERLNYETYTGNLSEGIASQPLLVPIILDVTPREARIIEDSMELLNEAGYEIELFGINSIKVSAVPFIYGKSDLRMLFTEMLDELELLKKAEKERRLDAVIQASCKHAVKAGDKLTEAEIKALLSAMRVSGAPPTCPHGRPVLKVFTKRNIEQLFKRIQ